MTFNVGFSVFDLRVWVRFSFSFLPRSCVYYPVASEFPFDLDLHGQDKLKLLGQAGGGKSDQILANDTVVCFEERGYMFAE